MASDLGIHIKRAILPRAVWCLVVFSLTSDERRLSRVGYSEGLNALDTCCEAFFFTLGERCLRLETARGSGAFRVISVR